MQVTMKIGLTRLKANTIFSILLYWELFMKNVKLPTSVLASDIFAVCLKGQPYEIFELWFFHQISPPGH
jgi:hypothetical protein